MNKLNNQLEAIKDQLEEKITDREMMYDERSEKWQEAESGNVHQKKTEELQEVYDNLQMTIDSLDTYMV